jgi:hypothetical protein
MHSPLTLHPFLRTGRRPVPGIGLSQFFFPESGKERDGSVAISP